MDLVHAEEVLRHDADLLRHLMEAKGISQSQLSREADLPKSSISEVLAGKKPFSRQMIRKLADYLGSKRGPKVKVSRERLRQILAEDAQRLVMRESAAGRSLVLKPLFGSQGRGLRLIHHESELPAPDAVAGIYYLQRFVGVEEEAGAGPGLRGDLRDVGNLFLGIGHCKCCM